eukprot:364933-Chlamydomonas_euryale.AAC.29
MQAATGGAAASHGHTDGAGERGAGVASDEKHWERRWEGHWEGHWEAHWEGHWEGHWEAHWEAHWEGHWEAHWEGRTQRCTEHWEASEQGCGAAHCGLGTASSDVVVARVDVVVGCAADAFTVGNTDTRAPVHVAAPCPFQPFPSTISSRSTCAPTHKPISHQLALLLTHLQQ